MWIKQFSIFIPFFRMKKPSRVQDDRVRAFLKVILLDPGRFKSAEGSGRDCCVASVR